ncbi:uncharacterized protein LOC142358651 isoform X2 [Convolutriloba macropyga]|uniref:uncharacterized protein LOC142358651 isoform X2 n=1 Tax=Convolutriloba macropyga TaxID=536237 RepID=UPI003F51B264
MLETTTVADQSSKASSPLRLCPSSATSTTAAATSRRQQRNGQQTAPNNHRTSEENSTTTTIRNKESKRKQQSGNKQSFKGKQHQVNTNSSTRAHHSSIINNQGKSYHNSQNPTAIEMQSAGFTLPASSPNGGGNSSSSATALSSSSSNGSSSNGAGGGKNYSSSYKVLTFEQFTKLDNLMNSDIEIHGQGTFPNIKVTLKEFVVRLKKNLEYEQVPLDSIRLNGGAASHVIGMRQMIDDIGYNDLDLIFGLKSDDENVFEVVRLMLYATLRSLLPFENSQGSSQTSEESNSTTEQQHSRSSDVVMIPSSHVSALSDGVIDDGYVQKMVKVSNNNDCWSLISLYNNDGENVEVKFVHRMKRQYEFSVDSFQIELDSLLCYYDLNDRKSVNFTKEFYPTVMAESKFGKFDEALFHLNNKLVATLKPEEIRGGGLLKYCNLLLNGYNIADSDIKNMERYMCSRFFIDFPDANSQQNKLQNYLRTHLRKAPRSSRRKSTQNIKSASTNTQNQQIVASQQADSPNDDKENVSVNISSPVQISVPAAVHVKEKSLDDGSLEQHRINFLLIARRIIDDSTVCLMNIERACTLNLLDGMISDLLRVYIAKAEGVKLYGDMAESGYYSENSSTVSNPLSSPSHFSRSSSPGVSMNGTTVSNASRSSSPASAAAAAVFGITGAQNVTASRLAHFDLAALCVPANGSFLHPASATGIHFSAATSQLIHAQPYATNFHHHGLSLISGAVGSFATSSSRGSADHSVLSMNHQHYHNHCHNQNSNASSRHSGCSRDSYHHGNGHHYQYHHHHHHQSKSGHGGSRSKGSNKDNYNYHYSKGGHVNSLSASLNSYHHNNHFYTSHNNHVSGQHYMTPLGTHHGGPQGTPHYASSSYVCGYGNDGYSDAFPPLGSSRSINGNSVNPNNSGNTYYYQSSYYGSSGSVNAGGGSSGSNYNSSSYNSGHNYSNNQHSRAANSPRQQSQAVVSCTAPYNTDCWSEDAEGGRCSEDFVENSFAQQNFPDEKECSSAKQASPCANTSFTASNHVIDKQTPQHNHHQFQPNNEDEVYDVKNPVDDVYEEEEDDDDDDVTSTSETSSTVSRDMMMNTHDSSSPPTTNNTNSNTSLKPQGLLTTAAY